MSRLLAVAAVSLLALAPVAAQQTPPMMPKVQEAPIPAPVVIPPPAVAEPDAPNEPLTADEAVRIALRRQPSIAVAGAGVAAAGGRERQSRAGLLPKLTATGSYNSAAGNGTSGSSSGSGYTGFKASAVASQLLFDFRHTRDLVRQSEALLDAARAKLTGAQSDLALQVKQAFYTLMQNRRQVEVNESNLKNQQNHLALAQARLKAGVGLPADVVRAETAIADAILSLNLANTSASSSSINLALLMGIDPRTPLTLADSDEPAPGESDLNALIETALRARPEMTGAEASIRAAEYALDAARSSNSPTFSANAGWSQQGKEIPLGNDTLYAGVSMTLTPFDSGLTAGKVTEAQAELDAARAQKESVRLSVVSDVSQAYLGVKSAEQRIATAGAEVTNAEESVRLAQGRYQSGLGTFLDVLDAQSSLLTARTNRVNAQSSLSQARASLTHALSQSPPTRG